MKHEIIDWKFTTENTLWENKKIICSEIDTPNFLKFESTNFLQEITGWGGCFNERGWKALSVLSDSDRKAVIGELFDQDKGAGFNICRVPIGASDFAIDRYTLNDHPGDYEMKYFSIERDKQYLIPYIKSAMEFNPKLKIWGSPWTPPAWMKTSNNFLEEYLLPDSKTRNSYALYFQKFVEEYQKEGINLFAIMPQNEPCWDYRDYLACGYTPGQNYDFMKNYLIPQFVNNNVNCEIWIGTVVDPQHGIHNKIDYVSCVLDDPAIAPVIKGIGCQYGTDIIKDIYQKYPQLQLMQTETPCGEGVNDLAYAQSQFDLIVHYMNSGVSSYMLWNMVLDQTGESLTGWRQSAPITVDCNTRKAIYNLQFYMFKHFSHYVKPGSKLLKTSTNGVEGLAFHLPDGHIAMILQNKNAFPINTAIGDVDGSITITLDGNSWNTLILS